MLQSAVDARGEDEHLEPVIDTGIEDEPDEPEMGVVKTIGYEFDYPVGHSQTPGVTEFSPPLHLSLQVHPLRPRQISNVPEIPPLLQRIFCPSKIGRLYQWRCTALLTIPLLTYCCGRCGKICGERIWCMLGPCWPMMLLTFSLILSIAGGTLLWASRYFHWVVIAAGFTLLCVNVTGLCLTACNNPGILKRQTELPSGAGNWKFHQKAGAYQPPGSKYCEETQVFVYKYDHFCPWTGTRHSRQ